MIIGIKIENGPEIQRALRDMIPKEARRVVRTATSKSALIWKQDVKRRISTLNMSESGKKQYAQSISVKTKNYGGTTVAIVGARNQKVPRTSVETRITRPDGTVRTLPRKATKQNNWANLSHLFEKGVAPHSLGKKWGKKGTVQMQSQGAEHPGIPAQPHILPAFFATRAAVVDRFTTLMRQLITRAHNIASRAA